MRTVLKTSAALQAFFRFFHVVQRSNSPRFPAELPLIVSSDKQRNIQSCGTGSAAVSAAGTEDAVSTQKCLGCPVQNFLLVCRERIGTGKGSKIILQLIQVGHSAEHSLHPGQPMRKRKPQDETERSGAASFNIADASSFKTDRIPPAEGRRKQPIPRADIEISLKFFLYISISSH